MKYACSTIDGGTSSLRFKTKTSDKHCVVVYMNHASRFIHMSACGIMDVKHHQACVL